MRRSHTRAQNLIQKEENMMKTESERVRVRVRARLDEPNEETTTRLRLRRALRENRTRSRYIAS
jgi:hypothetical protein